MPSPAVYSQLGRRERQLMEIVYRRGRATAAEILEELPDPPSYSAVRDLVRTFFDDSASAAVAAMIGQYEGHLSDAELDRLESLIDRARTAERKNTKGGRS